MRLCGNVPIGLIFGFLQVNQPHQSFILAIEGYTESEDLQVAVEKLESQGKTSVGQPLTVNAAAKLATT